MRSSASQQRLESRHGWLPRRIESRLFNELYAFLIGSPGPPPCGGGLGWGSRGTTCNHRNRCLLGPRARRSPPPNPPPQGGGSKRDPIERESSPVERYRPHEPFQYGLTPGPSLDEWFWSRSSSRLWLDSFSILRLLSSDCDWSDFSAWVYLRKWEGAGFWARSRPGSCPGRKRTGRHPCGPRPSPGR